MQIKAKGLNIEYENGYFLGFSITIDSIREFCEYHKIKFDDEDLGIFGVVSGRKAAIHSFMLTQYFSIALNNNWRKRHGIPMLKRKYLQI